MIRTLALQATLEDGGTTAGQIPWSPTHLRLKYCESEPNSSSTDTSLTLTGRYNAKYPATSIGDNSLG
jgi:hypothetical protein